MLPLLEIRADTERLGTAPGLLWKPDTATTLLRQRKNVVFYQREVESERIDLRRNPKAGLAQLGPKGAKTDDEFGGFVTG